MADPTIPQTTGDRNAAPQTVMLSADAYGHWYIAEGDEGGRQVAYYVRGDVADELLSVLRGCVEAMERNNVGDGCVPSMNRLIAARAAIAKAEGRDA